MIFESDDDDDFMIFNSGSIAVSSKSRKLTIQDGSTHLLPIVNKKSLEFLQKEKVKRLQKTFKKHIYDGKENNSFNENIASTSMETNFV